MSTSDSTVSEKYRKESIIDQAQAIYGSRYAKNHTWSVIIERTKDARYKAHVIVYVVPGSLERWTVLKSSMKEATPTKALAHLMEVLETEVGAKFFRQ